ncbi:hypothetical protein [Roseibium sp.]|uniref:hypothetical protein n=1 Tax=Roseibium sp. TaxID=1936156 RepID=UPI003B51B8F9
MRLLTSGLAALAVCAFAVAPAHACSWGKTASSGKMTVAETSTVPETDVSIATNDLSEETLKEVIVPTETPETPAD